MSASDLDRTLDRGRALVHALDFVHDINFVLDLARAFDRDRDLDLARDLARIRNLDHARALDRDLARALDRALARARARAFDLSLALALVRDLAFARDLAARADAFGLVRDCDVALHVARDLVVVIGATGSSADSATKAPVVADARSEPKPVRSALKMLTTAIRILPAGDRWRYDEELRGELYVLAAAGATRLVQLRYAVRQVDRAFELRAELRRPARRGARP